MSGFEYHLIEHELQTIGFVQVHVISVLLQRFL